MPRKRRKKVGLALSSGAARGLAHLGVLEVLERERIPVDMIAGTSAGALIGAVYAQKRDAIRTKNLIVDLLSRRFALLRELSLSKSGLSQGKRIKAQLTAIIGDAQFSDLTIPFACVATDISTGEEVIIKEGSVVEGIRASSSLPLLFAVVKRGDRYLVDGGLVRPVPVNILREMGADFVIAVNVVPDLKERIHLNENPVEAKEPNIFSVLMHMIHTIGYQAVRSSVEDADVIIEPRVAHIGFGDFHRGSECIAQGILAAQKAIPEIRKKLQA